MKIGYTGTQIGMSKDQIITIKELINHLKETEEIEEVHHGDCIGGDSDFDIICKNRFKRVIHPPIYPNKRAWCDGEIILEKKPYLERNRDIAKMDILIATPKEYEEVLRSGTWATVRYARKAGTAIYIIWPDGTIKKEEACDQEELFTNFDV